MAFQASNANNRGIFQELFTLLGKLVHADLVRQIQYLKVENEILRSKLKRNIHVTPRERRRLLKFGLVLGPQLRHFLSIVCYETFRGWVRNRNGKYKIIKRGRKRTHQDIRDLIVRLAQENNWGYTRILGELKKLGIYSLSRNTVKNILKENGIDPAPQRGEDTWDQFIKRHFETLWACDFFTKTVWTLLGPKTFHVLFFIHVKTRKVHIAGITDHPVMEWVDKTARSLSFLIEGGTEKVLFRDQDSKFKGKFDEILKSHKVDVRKIPFKSPNLNPYAEGWVGTIKRECLNHFIVFGEKHFKHLVNEFVHYYNTSRPHSSLDNNPLDIPMQSKNSGLIRSESKLGGLIKHYYRSD